MKNILVIDGNYFGHRVIHGIRISEPECSLKTFAEQQNFAAGLNDSLLNTFASFNNEYHSLLWGIVFVFDNKSWRKDIPGHRPYYIDELSTEKIGYKDNREELKEASDIDWDAFETCMNAFRDRISGTIACFNPLGNEGDDCLLLLRDLLTEDGTMMWMFATDGDLAQLVNEKCILFKNVKSKLSPEGEYYISPTTWNKVFVPNKDMLSVMKGGNFEKEEFSNFFRVQLNGGRSRGNLQRLPGVSVKVAEPLLTGLLKVICGDKKDNVFPIIRWIKGSKNFKVTEKMVEAVWKERNVGELNEQSAIKFFTDKEVAIGTFAGLIQKCQPQTTHLLDGKTILAHYKHNLKVIMLRKEYLPVEVVDQFKIEWLDKKDRAMGRITMEDLLRMGLSTEIVDSATELHIGSVPMNPIVGGQTQSDISNENKSIIDDILGN
jgi:hypothetical protein